MGSEKKIAQYSKYFEKGSLFKKIIDFSGKAGTSILFYALLLYFLIIDKKIPLRTRLIFMAALGYFILPTDMISDFLPIIGFTDDLAFLTYALTQGTDHITPEVKSKAKKKLNSLLKKEITEEDDIEDNSWSDGVVWSEE